MEGFLIPFMPSRDRFLPFDNQFISTYNFSAPYCVAFFPSVIGYQQIFYLLSVTTRAANKRFIN